MAALTTVVLSEAPVKVPSAFTLWIFKVPLLTVVVPV
jgi:hypothetical protein